MRINHEASGQECLIAWFNLLKPGKVLPISRFCGVINISLYSQHPGDLIQEGKERAQGEAEQVHREGTPHVNSLPESPAGQQPSLDLMGYSTMKKYELSVCNKPSRRFAYP